MEYRTALVRIPLVLHSSTLRIQAGKGTKGDTQLPYVQQQHGSKPPPLSPGCGPQGAYLGQVLRDEDVVWFDVSMQDVAALHVLQGHQHLPRVHANSIEGQAANLAFAKAAYQVS